MSGRKRARAGSRRRGGRGRERILAGQVSLDGPPVAVAECMVEDDQFGDVSPVGVPAERLSQQVSAGRETRGIASRAAKHLFVHAQRVPATGGG